MTETLERSWTQDGRPKLRRRGTEAGPGPWWDEPDKVQWIDPATGLDCLMVRNGWGAWCGYVGLPPGHPLHGVDYDVVDVDVHGGLTFAASCDDEAPEDGGICHVPFPGRPVDVWWLGFDCGHAWDLQPAMEERSRRLGYHSRLSDEVYRDWSYVADQVRDLALQLAAA